MNTDPHSIIPCAAHFLVKVTRITSCAARSQSAHIAGPRGCGAYVSRRRTGLVLAFSRAAAATIGNQIYSRARARLFLFYVACRRVAAHTLYTDVCRIDESKNARSMLHTYGCPHLYRKSPPPRREIDSVREKVSRTDRGAREWKCVFILRNYYQGPPSTAAAPR